MQVEFSMAYTHIYADQTNKKTLSSKKPSPNLMQINFNNNQNQQQQNRHEIKMYGQNMKISSHPLPERPLWI